MRWESTGAMCALRSGDVSPSLCLAEWTGCLVVASLCFWCANVAVGIALVDVLDCVMLHGYVLVCCVHKFCCSFMAGENVYHVL